MAKQSIHKFPDYKETPIELLIPYANNSRTHSESQISKIAKSIREFGFLNPIIVDAKGGIIAGHGRVLGAQKVGLKTLPTIEAKHLTPRQTRAYVIADNQLALEAGWDMDILRFEIEQLFDSEFDIAALGFNTDFLETLMNIDSDLPDLIKGARDPFQQKTFILHDDQASLIEGAISKAKKNPLIKTGLNTNSNGNAIVWICEQWLKTIDED